MLIKLKKYIEVCNSMLLYLITSIKTLLDRINDIGIWYTNDSSSVVIGVGNPHTRTFTCAKPGVYVFIGSCEWATSAPTLTTVIDFIDKDNTVLAQSRNTMADGGGSSISTIMYCDTGDTVTLRIAWAGGSGSATAQKIRFRMVRVGGVITQKVFSMLLPKRVIAC